MSSTSDQHTQPARRNWLAFFGDYVAFGLGLTLVSTNTTLPAFAATLTDSKILIGAASAVWLGGWLLPQVFAGNYLSDKPDKLPFVIQGSWIGRPFFWIFALFLLVGGARFPTLTLAIFLAGLLLFMGMDALVALAWFDLFAKAMPGDERGRLIGAGQTVTGLLSLGAGALVYFLLSDAGPPYPINYAAIFALAGTCFMASLWACYYIVEFPGEVKEKPAAWREFLPQMGAVWRDDSIFARVTVVRLLAGLHAMALPFYVIYALQVGGVPAAAVGGYLTAQTAGLVIAGVVLGPIADRWGAQRVIQIAAGLDCLAPVLALGLIALGRSSLFIWVYPVVFVLTGIFDGSVMLGFLNFVLEIAPADSRPTYMGLTNTAAGLLVAMPLIGGWLLQHTSYSTLFAISALGVAAATALALTLPNPRRPAPDLGGPVEAIAPAP